MRTKIPRELELYRGMINDLHMSTYRTMQASRIFNDDHFLPDDWNKLHGCLTIISEIIDTFRTTDTDNTKGEGI